MLSKIKKLLGLKKNKEVISKDEIIKLLPPNPHILEAGASDGKDTLDWSKRLPNAQIYAFEPVPTVHKVLKERVSGQKNVHLYTCALSDAVGEFKMYVSSGASHGSSSLLAPKEHLTFHKDVHFKEEITVKTKRLDDWAAENGVDRIDFMWLDMQGGEMKALEGGQEILKTTKIIYTEVSLMEMYEGVPLYDQFRKWMEERGFVVVQEELLWEDMGNVLFVRP